ncbi:MAG: BACON domain-containing protein, partial [Lachnospiraceae bacterium]|nr:BACON domain-containing protein [Lachnospiraceae bacterium]
MRRLQQKRSIAKFLCFLMILEMFVAFPNVAEASVSKTISKNGREYCAVEGDKQTITVTLASPNKPENTKVVSSSVPGWASVSKPNYNSPVFKVTVQRNTGNGSRVQNIEFTDGTNTWTLTLTQYVYTPPSTTPKKPTTQPKKDNPTKSSTPTPKSTPVPTSTPTPLPALTTDATALNFRADGETKSVTIGGYSGPLRADRGDTWFTVSVSGGIVSVTATKNTSTARTSYFDITDTGSGRSVRIRLIRLRRYIIRSLPRPRR